MAICFDCRQATNDYVLEVRQVSGGDGMTFANDFQERPVHANRRVCYEAQAKEYVCVICGSDKGSRFARFRDDGSRYFQHDHCVGIELQKA